jgi:hypothetical protein
VLLANYQSGNASTDRIFKRWLSSILGPLVYLPLPTLPDPPATPPGWMAGPLAENEWEAFSRGVNEFYAGFNFFQPTTGAGLRALCARTPLASPFRHAFAVVDARGDLLAGLIVMEEYRLKKMEIHALPAPIRALNRVMQFLPRDGAMREVYLDHLWFRPGQALAARHLVDTVRWIWQDRATNVSVLIDPRGPVKAVFPTRPWTIQARTRLAVMAPEPVDPARRICPIY